MGKRSGGKKGGVKREEETERKLKPSGTEAKADRLWGDFSAAGSQSPRLALGFFLNLFSTQKTE